MKVRDLLKKYSISQRIRIMPRRYEGILYLGIIQFIPFQYLDCEVYDYSEVRDKNRKTDTILDLYIEPEENQNDK